VRRSTHRANNAGLPAAGSKKTVGSVLHAGSFVPSYCTSLVFVANTQTDTKPAALTELRLEGVWRVVVLNDPVNLMSYVVMVFKKVFGFDEQTARKKMLEVHELGRSIVWSGLREKAEAYAFTLQQWHLTAVLEPDEAH
jgi:ATP-dependent Clp protease adaptor protein ClpS